MTSKLTDEALNYVRQRDFLIPLGLSMLFVVCFFFYSHVFFCALIGILLIFINYYPLSSRFTENILFLCLPVIGFTANYYSLCLVFNSTVFMLFTRSYACHGTVKFRYVILFLLMIVSFAWYRESADIVYMGALMHGIVGPINIWLYSRKNKYVNKLVFLVPLWMLLHNFSSGYYFVAYWDVEIMSYYVGWFLGYDKQTVVKRMFTLSFLIITYAYLGWDVCEGTGP